MNAIAALAQLNVLTDHFVALVEALQEWTLDELIRAAVRWLKIRPRDLPVRQEVRS